MRDCVIKGSDDTLQSHTRTNTQLRIWYANFHCVLSDRNRQTERLRKDGISFFSICMNNNIIEVDITLCCPQTHSSSNLFQLRVNTLFSLAFALFAYIMEFCQAQTKMYDNDDGRGDNNYIVILMCKDSP